jgi:endonuclease/exonuclease/phosphatase family metal-dependent hydrolase
LAAGVISELDVEIIALQEVLRPFDAEDPLEVLADELGLHLTSVSTRVHRHGELRNAILSRWPMTSAFTIDLSLSRLEQRSAIVTQFEGGGASVSIVSTHLALVDRTRKRQVQSLLDDERLQGAAILLGDMNAWRRCPATRTLEREFTILHHNRAWPPSFPSTRPVLALDRIYARGANVRSLRSHDTPAARKASDHLPVLATVDLDD